MSTHTPGPWRVGAEKSFVFLPGLARPIACGSRANAALISAAPDLYEALSGLVGMCALLLANDLPVNVRDALENNHRVKAAHEALRKAEGAQ